MRFLIVFLATIFLFSSCKKEKESTVFEGFKVPANFPPPVYNFQQNPVTKEGFELGKKIFYDGRLSRDGTISCGECHISFSAFSHVNHPLSHGIDGQFGIRNAPSLQNMAWMRTFFWDGGVLDLDLFPINPITNSVEMDEHIPNVINKLKADANYIKDFKAAFGSEEITPTKMYLALSQFMCMLVSADSKFDKVQSGHATFTLDEKEGYQIFQQKCSECHHGSLFTDQEFRNNGIAIRNDKGRSHITQDPNDDYCFKVPSLRNIAKTSPYMHDGRFETLEAVLNHYEGGVNASASLDTILQRNGRLGISLSATEKTQLIAFLNTLTDESFIKNPLFAQ